MAGKLLITPNSGSVTAGQDPTIKFQGTGNSSDITLRVTSTGALSFEGTSGQLFSVTDSMSGTIYSVNDISGIPSIEVLDTGLIKLAQYSGNVVLGSATDDGINKLQVTGPISITGQLTSTVATGTAPLVVASTTMVTNLNADLHDGLQTATANTASTVVARDASGNFSAGTITATLSGTATSVTTNANLTGPITSTGNTTAIASQTGTGTKFVMDTSPTLVTPNIGVASGTSFNSITGLSATTPVMNGTAAIGTATTVAKADHVHPSDTTKLSLSGGTMSGTLTIPTGQVISITDSPTIGTSAANKNYVDAVAAGLTWKNAVAAATTANITLSGTQTIDGVALVVGNRALVKNQTTTSQNGIYVVASGAWTRATDMDATTPLNEFNGAGVLVTGGTLYDNTAWTVTSTVSTVGTDAVTWAQFTGGGAISAGTGLTLTGNTLSVNASQTQITSVGTLSSLATSSQNLVTNLNADFLDGLHGSNYIQTDINGAAKIQNFTVGYSQGISNPTLGTYTFDGANRLTAVVGKNITIQSPGTTDFTLFGAPNNNYGTSFVVTVTSTPIETYLGTTGTFIFANTESATNSLAIGYGALTAGFGIWDSLAIGWNALNSLSSGWSTIAIGNWAGQNLDVADDSILLGSNAGAQSKNITSSIGIGTSALINANYDYCIAIGQNALAGNPGDANDPGIGKINQSIAIGANALSAYSSTYGGHGQNIAIGAGAGESLQGTGNLSVGIGAHQFASTKLDTTNTDDAISLGVNSSPYGGSRTIAIGNAANAPVSGGSIESAGTDNVYIGHAAGRNATSYTHSNSIAIGSNAISKGSNTAIIGTPSTTYATYLNGEMHFTNTNGAYDHIVIFGNTANRTYTFPDQSGTIALTSDITGTVSSVSIVTANGISGTVATNTTTPAITLTLGAITPSSITSTGAISGSILTSTVATGTAPLNIASTTLVTNLNADLLDGNQASAFATSGHTHTGVYQPIDADLTAIAALAGTSGLLKKTATDTWTLDTTAYTANLGTVTSVSVTTANGISGTVATNTTTPAITLTLGAITPTSISTSGQITSSLTSGTAPLVITSTTLVSNLNADMIDGYHAASTNTASTVVARDASGNFSAGTITASLSGTASNVTTNANLTGPITSTGNTTTIASQTGTGTKFVMDTSPTLITPNIGVASGTSFNGITGLASASPLMDGTATIGTSTLAAKQDHIHPSDTTKLSLSGGTMTGSIVIPTGQDITLTDQPTIGTDAVNKNYVDAAITGLTWKNSAAAGTTTNINLATGGLLVIDSYQTVAGDRIVVKNQTAGAENGVYIVNVGAWTRALDADTGTELNHATIFIEHGATQGATGWTVSNANLPVLGVDAITFVQFAGGPSIVAGTGLTLTGNTLSVNASQTQITSVGTLSSLSVSGAISGSTLTSTIATGTSPITITSTTLVANLNADLLDGNQATAFALSGHTHGNISNTGTIGTTSGLPIITAAGGSLTAGSFGSTVGTFCAGDDARLATQTTVSGQAGYVQNSVTFNSSGTGAASGTTFNGSAVQTISYNTIGAQVAGTYTNTVNGYSGTVTLTNLGLQNFTAGSTVSGTNTGDNAVNSNYSSDYRATNFVAGTNYLAPGTTFYIGTTSIANNRASLAQSLTGVSIDGLAGTVTSLSGHNISELSNNSGYVTSSGVTSIIASTGLSGGTITSTGTIALANTTVTAGSYTNANITVDAQGRLTAASSGSSGVTSVNGNTGAVTAAQISAAATSGYGFTPVSAAVTLTTAAQTNITSVGTLTNLQTTSLGVGTAASGTAGEIRATNNITAYYSDDRLKTRTGNIENALDKVSTLDTFYYHANETAQALGYKPIDEVGISAQQVQAIMPQVVAPAPIDDKYLTVRYERLVPLLIAAIKELQAEVNQLKGK